MSTSFDDIALRRAMASTGFSDLKEFQRAGVVVTTGSGV
jgi:hypothetical protein